MGRRAHETTARAARSMKKLDLKELPATNAGTKRPLSRFARRLSQACVRLALPSDGRIVVAVSGGADSTALLLAFDELNKAGRMMLRLKVAHLDHELRGEAGAGDARFVAELAAALGYEAAIGSAAVGQRAALTRDNLEQAARRERYEFLGGVARAWEARAVAVAHTQEDQAETLLLALLRGSGARGLGAMSDSRPFDASGDELRLVRPLLGWARRAETVEYCAARGVSVRSDAMNDDERFARVRVRRQLLPLLETFNPRAVETLARTARLLRAEADALEHLGGQLLAAASRDASAKAEAKRAEERGARGRPAACDRAI
ncbi:MAG TPA: tRNA lysidine(34) synthetase TilS, partial [Pyrinomonadaceae bacterium]